MKLYTYSINIITGKIKQAQHEFDDYDEDVTGYASYNDDGFENVYAESLISAAEARRLVYLECMRLANRFSESASKIFCSILDEANIDHDEPECELEEKKDRLRKLAEELGVKISFGEDD